jgi:heme exporter protein D
MWASWADFWSMGGRGSFVWGAYGMALAVVAIEVIMVRARYRRARHDLTLLKATRARQSASAD